MKIERETKVLKQLFHGTSISFTLNYLWLLLLLLKRHNGKIEPTVKRMSGLETCQLICQSSGGSRAAKM